MVPIVGVCVILGTLLVCDENNLELNIFLLVALIQRNTNPI
jgi:hypothetical protein